MNTLKAYIITDMERKQQYFAAARQEITRQNLHLLQLASLSTVWFLVLFFLLTPLIIPEWAMTPQHFWFLPSALILYFVSLLYQKFGRLNFTIVTLLCILFELIVAVFIILIDVFTAKEAPGSFFPPLCVALPAMFILQLRLSYLMIFLFESLFITLTVLYKTPFIAQYDIFASIVVIAFSFVIAHTILHLRAKDFDLRLKYQQLSQRDSLSNILNKKAFEETSRAYLENPAFSSQSCALLIFDIDNFKTINDSLGHYAGDQLLTTIGNLLPKLFRTTDIVGRFGGDEFVVLLKGTIPPDSLDKKCDLLHQKISNIGLEDLETEVTCSIGVAISQNNETTYENLFRTADQALYLAKREGKKRHHLLHA